ncbi:chondroitin sulfate N-acetylgalactosaminyltransferase 1 [Hyalella azteca]|uniref:Hexosyltransferase n=1 Tax=Hyalella azteca TaxID=294128 RepID=A0A979FXW9_HYAAZ|nr:chondroitin sulfate N-acetylgalactosaminyltransferase 1 [Hyalella azteca]
MFLTDVDMSFSDAFMDRCRSSAVKGRQVFFPIVFSRYNQSLLEPPDYLRSQGSKLDPKNIKYEIHQEVGYWRIFGHGNVCAYRSDLLKVGGFDGLERHSWGGEDIQLLDKFVATKRYKIVRSLEPSLEHLHHGKNCSGVSKESKQACEDTKYRSEASQRTYGAMYFKNKQL